MSMIKHASFPILAAAMGEIPAVVPRSGVKTAHRTNFTYEARPGYIYVRSRMISSRTNENHDDFPAEEITAAWQTFRGKPAFVNHVNSDPSRARGVIIDAALHPDTNPDGTPDTWVEGLHEVDAERFPLLARLLMDGSIQRTSMGTNVQYSECTFCGNRAETPLQYCAHVKTMKGRRIPRHTAAGKQSVLVAETCRGLHFFENSFLVEPPADPTAHVLGVDSAAVGKTAARETITLAQVLAEGLPTHQRALARTAARTASYEDAVVAPPHVDTLRPDDCPVCGDDAFDGESCGNCGYVAPPDQLQDPDLDAARELRGDDPPPPPPEGEDVTSIPAGTSSPPPLSFAGGLRPGRRTGVDGTMSSKSRGARPSRPGAQRQEQIRQQATAAQAPAGQPTELQRLRATVAARDEVIAKQGRAILTLRDGLAFVLEQSGLAGHPKVARIVQSAEEPEDDYEAGKAEGEKDADTGSDLSSEAAQQRFASWSPRRQVGWADGFQARTAALKRGARRRTAADEDKDPVATTSEQALQPAAKDDPESIGAAPSGANTGVTPQATTDPVSTDVAIPQEPFNKLVDVTQQGGVTPPAVGDSHVKVDITSEKPSTDVPFKETGWTSTSRLLASIGLARLRIAQGAADEGADDLSVGQQIHDDAGMSDADIVTESKTRQQVQATAGRQQPRTPAARPAQPARRPGVAPQAARRSPSLAPQAGASSRVASSGGGALPAGDQFFDL